MQDLGVAAVNATPTIEQIHTTCVIAGGGPAGMMLGFLLARAGGMRIGDFTHLPTQCRFIALMPQWDFLNFLAVQAARYPAFNLRMKAEVTELIEQDGRFVGLRANTSTGKLVITVALVIGADGRIRPCASGQALSSTILARRSTSCGCACRATQAMAMRSCASASARRW
jgi:FAD binding domain-containing protein